MTTIAERLRALVDPDVFTVCAEMLRFCRERPAEARGVSEGPARTQFYRLRGELKEFLEDEEHDDESVDRAFLEGLTRCLAPWRLPEALKARAIAETIDEHWGRSFGLIFRPRADLPERRLQEGDALPVAWPPLRQLLQSVGTRPDNLTRRYDATTHMRLVPPLEGRTLVVDGRADDATGGFTQGRTVAGAIPNVRQDELEWFTIFDEGPRFSGVRPCNVEDQWDRIERLLDAACQQKATVLVYPELSFTPELVTRFEARLQSLKVPPPDLIVAGSVHAQDADGSWRNRAPVFAKRRLVAWHDKLVPFDIREGDTVIAEDIRVGNEIRLFWSTSGWMFTVLICRDGLDPRIVSVLGDLQVRLLLAPAWSLKTSALETHVEALAVAAQTLSVVANLPADPKGYPARSCVPLIVGLPRSAPPCRVRLPDPMPDKPFLGTVEIKENPDLAFFAID